jgi:hypothetical protein
VLFYVLLASAGLFAADQNAAAASATKFYVLETEVCTFKLNKIELSDLQQKGIVFGIECIQKTYEDLFGFTFPEGFKIKVVLFQQKQDFLDYQRKTINKVISESGYFSTANAEAVTWLQGDFKRMVGVLFHEASHMLLMQQVPWVPLWINEGLAEYFESLNLFDGTRCICLQESRMSWCEHWLKTGFPVGFQRFFAMNRDQWNAFDKANNNAGYTMGYSIVYFLMTGPRTQSILKEILWDFKRNGYKADSVATINQYYPGGIRKLEMHWKRWIPRAKPKQPLTALMVKTKEKKMKSVPSAKTENKP